MTRSEARAYRGHIETAVQFLPTNDALQVATLHPKWEVGKICETGKRYFYAGNLYEVNEGQTHTAQADWTPDVATSLFKVVNETHAGTLEDPIPALRNMEYTYGLYYLDPDDGKIYLCQRSGEETGNTVTLNYLPHELVGHYFAEVA